MPEIVGHHECCKCKKAQPFERIIACWAEVQKPKSSGVIGCNSRQRSPTVRIPREIPLPFIMCSKCHGDIRFVGPTPGEVQAKIDALYRMEQREIFKEEAERRKQMPDPLANLDLSKLALSAPTVRKNYTPRSRRNSG